MVQVEYPVIEMFGAGKYLEFQIIQIPGHFHI